MADRRDTDVLIVAGDVRAVVADLALAVAGRRLDPETAKAVRREVYRAIVELGEVARVIGSPLPPVEVCA